MNLHFNPRDHHTQATTRRRMGGTSLIEILVAVVVLSTGLLGMVALQAKALRNNQSSLERSQAVVLTYSILERMRANAAAAESNAYDYTWSAACPAPGNGSLANNDLTNWIGEVRAGLDEKHHVRGARGQSIGEHAARRAASHDDEVECRRGVRQRRLPLFRRIGADRQRPRFSCALRAR